MDLTKIIGVDPGVETPPGYGWRRAYLLFHGNDCDGAHEAHGTHAGDTCRERDEVAWFAAIFDGVYGNDHAEQVAGRGTCREAVVNSAHIADLFRRIADAFDERAANSNGKRRKRRRPSITKTRPPGESDERARDEARRILRERGFVGGSSDD